MNNRKFEKGYSLQLLKVSIIFFTILLICNKSHSQPLGFYEAECGIDTSAPYHFVNYSLPHNDYYNLFHGSSIIYTQGVNYGPLYHGVLLRFINDSTGFFVSQWLDGYKFNVFKINNDNVNQIGGGYPPPNIYDFFVVNEHTAYLVTGAGNHVFIYKCTDNLPPSTLIYDNTSGIAVFDTIIGTPICDSLSELNFHYYNVGDTLEYKIILNIGDSITNYQKIDMPICNVFPNPANEKLLVDIYEKATLEIINIQGQIVDTKSLTEKSNYLDLSNLVSGVYTLRIKTEKGIAMKKLIKQ